jgi:hypothetical protein
MYHSQYDDHLGREHDKKECYGIKINDYMYQQQGNEGRIRSRTSIEFS